MASEGHVFYDNQLGTTLGDRMSFDQSVPYTLACNYWNIGTSTYNQSFCLIENPGSYSVGADGTKVNLAKDVSVVLGDCHVKFYVPSNAGGNVSFGMYLFVGTTEDVVGTDTVYLYRWCCCVPPGEKIEVEIPDISGFVVPSGKNVVFGLYSSGASVVK